MKKVVFIFSLLIFISCQGLYVLKISNTHNVPIVLSLSELCYSSKSQVVPVKKRYHNIDALCNNYKFKNDIFIRVSREFDLELRTIHVLNEQQDTLETIRISSMLLDFKDFKMKLPFALNDTIVGKKYKRKYRNKTVGFYNLSDYFKMQYYYNIGNYQKALKYSNVCIKLSDKIKIRNSLLIAYLSSKKVRDYNKFSNFRSRLINEFNDYWMFLNKYDAEVRGIEM